jgi:signal transduction histidine kinase
MSVVPTGGQIDAAADAGELRRCLSDIVGLSTLSAVWASATRQVIAESLAVTLRDTLGADLVYVGLRGSATGTACDGSACGVEDTTVCDTIRAQVAAWFRDSDAGGSLPDLSGSTAPTLVTPIGIHAAYGVIVTMARHGGFPSEIHRLLLNTAANQATVALLTDRARDEQRIADTLQRIGTGVAAELDPEKVIQTVTDEGTALTGAAFGAFFYNVVNAAGDSYMLYTLSGAPREAFSRFPMPRSTAIFAPTFAGTAVVRLADVTQDPRFGHNPPYHGMPPGHLPVRSYLAVPVRSRTGKVHGGLFFGHPEPDMFMERHERLAVGVAAWAALAMDNGYLYADAQRANMAKDHFLATLSHELRTPLNALAGWLSMLRRPAVMTAAGVPKAWAAIDRNTAALTDLVEDLLDISRIATGKIRLADAEVDLNDVVRDSVRTMEPRVVEKRLQMASSLPPQPCLVRGDVARLRQVVGNLLANAVKFTGRDGQVNVTVTCTERSAAITVADTGIGIHPDFLPHLFERFRQADSDSTTGLGLGLAIVKNLVELHGGTVAAASEGIGRGSTFTVTLPRMHDSSGTVLQ